MNASDLDHTQTKNLLKLTDKQTGRSVQIMISAPGNKKYVVFGDNGRCLMTTNLDVLARQSTYAYLEEIRRKKAG